MPLVWGKWGAALVVFVLAATLGGCAADPQRPAAAPAHSLPAGYRWVRIESVGLEFAIAQSWTVVTKQHVVGLPTGSPELAALAESVGEPPDDLAKQMSVFDALIVAPRAGGKWQESVSVITAPGTPLDIDYFESIAAGQDPKPTVARVRTPLGQGIQITSTSTSPTGEVHDWTLDLDTPQGMTSFSILTHDEASAQSFVDALIQSIHMT